jgi:hypothetical protein
MQETTGPPHINEEPWNRHEKGMAVLSGSACIEDVFPADGMTRHHVDAMAALTA